jgi:hypothetical protein
MTSGKSSARRAEAPLIVRASFVSQETCLAVLGIKTRKFLEVLVPLCGRNVIRVGRTVLVPIDVAEAALLDLAGEAVVEGRVELQDQFRQPGSVDEVLAHVGLRAARGMR